MAEISIIITYFNREKYLEKAIASVLNQSYSDLEIILIDDSSTDTSRSIASSYARMDSRIVLVNNQINRGGASTFAQGLNMATGKYLGCVDSDDFIDKYCIEKCREMLLRLLPHKELVYTKCVWVDENDNFIKYCSRATKKLNRQNMFRGMIPFHFRLFTKNVWNKTIITAKKFSASYEFLLQAYQLTDFALVDEYLYFYRQHEDSVCRLFNSQRKQEIRNFKKRFVDYYQ